MNKKTIKLIVSASSIMFLIIACSQDYPDGHLDKFHDYEENWGNCFNERFYFPNGFQAKGVEFITFNINDRNELIDSTTSGFKTTAIFEYGWVTGSPNTPLINEGAQNWLQISFIEYDFWRKIALVIKYPTDSLNYVIQKTFSKSQLNLSSNFVETTPRFEISAHCDWISSSIIFSTLYSTRLEQPLNIDNFNFEFHDGLWYYHLEYSFNELEITNAVWNSKSKWDLLDKDKKSDILIENILVRNAKCVIEFELPPD